ncbi:probable 3-hydroxyisobutyryl-CoA hydrolase 2 [Impatiens glandulifera]|uniref:probable 3-hydroxyisobutyryl-CoA hydrolase 2 n=1 Tax=Impatiens glandulifera TaxID=253017 RepID=UPI001FB0A361|nr:probable 3-hydroxyisobutyryl-CoA hydrolase 2 [Impatiens glandulifera]
MINKCFSEATIENILSSLVNLSIKNEDKLILNAIKSMKDGSPTNLKIFLKLGLKAMLIEKDKTPQWNPSSLEEVKEETVKKHFEEMDDDEFQPLVLDASRTLNDGLVLQLLKNLMEYELDPNVNLVMIKANGKAFSAGGDLLSTLGLTTAGHWSLTAKYYYKWLTLLHLNITYKKPLVNIVNGFAIGGGATMSTFATFRIVTENTIFSLPEIAIGIIPNVGAGYILSRLPGYFGEFLGLTGARIDGADMIACGLATHFVPSKVCYLLLEAQILLMLLIYIIMKLA